MKNFDKPYMIEGFRISIVQPVRTKTSRKTTWRERLSNFPLNLFKRTITEYSTHEVLEDGQTVVSGDILLCNQYTYDCMRKAIDYEKRVLAAQNKFDMY